jgi:hypothetical protein
MPSSNRFGFLHNLLAPTSTHGELQYTAVEWLANADPAMLALVTSAEIFKNRYALFVLYYSTNGPGWNNNTNWLSSSSVCDWVGVNYCSSTDIVADLYLCKLLEHKLHKVVSTLAFAYGI